jgi:hypothetical protein
MARSEHLTRSSAVKFGCHLAFVAPSAGAPDLSDSPSDGPGKLLSKTRMIKANIPTTNIPTIVIANFLFLLAGMLLAAFL